MIREIYFILFIFYSYILFSSFSYSFLTYLQISKGLNKTDYSQNSIERLVIISLGLGFCFLFIFFSITNLIGHTFGIDISSQFFWLISCGLTFYLFKDKLKKFKNIFQGFIFKNYNKLIFKNFAEISLREPILSILKISIFIEILCIFYRLFFPVTHGDQLTHYFFDALQISRLNSLTIKDFYNLGGSLRTDSLPSFFDAFNLQMSGSWTISRISKVFSLIIALSVGVEFMSSLKKVSLNKIIIFIAVITSLVDIWSLTVSGKYDIYIFTLEIVAFRVSLLINSIKDLDKRIYLVAIVFSITITAVFSRLSSLALLLTVIIFSIYHVFQGLKFYKFRLKILIISFFSLIIFTAVCGSIGIFNFIYFKNPFFIISPPNLFTDIFPNALYEDNYSEFTKVFNLRNIPLILKPPLTIIYSALGLEQIRFLSYKFSDFNFLLQRIYDYLSFFGPEQMMIAIDSSSPLILLSLSFKNENDLFRNSSKKILVFLFFWLFLWALGIAYTRVAIASSTLLIAFALAHYKPKRSNNESQLLFASRKVIFNYSLLLTLLYSIWSLSSIFDLPNIKGLIPYNRSNLIREFLILDHLNQKNIVKKAPNELFEKNWNNIKRTKYPNILLNVPKQYAYFMNKGLIINEKRIRSKSSVINYRGTIFKLYEQSKFEKLDKKEYFNDLIDFKEANDKIYNLKDL